jgi:hypothetical protein
LLASQRAQLTDLAGHRPAVHDDLPRGLGQGRVALFGLPLADRLNGGDFCIEPGDSIPSIGHGMLSI